MKIGIDARFWNESGVGRYIRNLVIELAKIDKKNEYVLFVRDKDLSGIKNAVSKINHDKQWSFVSTDIHWHSFNEQIKLPQILNKENLDLMHFPYFSVPVLYSGPFVITIHDLILHHYSTGEATTKNPAIYHIKRLAYKLIIKHAALKAKKIITVSEASKTEISQHLKANSDKISVIYEGIDAQLSQKAKNSTIYPNLPKSYFLHVGNLYPHKNMDIVLECFKEIKEQGVGDVYLVIAGKEDYFYKKFRQSADAFNLSENVKFLGEVSDNVLYNLYKNAHAYISPSLMEGFDLPVVEAMAQGCLVVVSDIPVHREICQDAAIYFSLKSKKDLIAKILEIVKSDKKKFNSQTKQTTAFAAGFSWTKMAEKTLKIYESSLSL